MREPRRPFALAHFAVRASIWDALARAHSEIKPTIRYQPYVYEYAGDSSKPSIGNNRGPDGPLCMIAIMSRGWRWIIGVVLAVVIIASFAFAMRHQVTRAFIAGAIYRSHVFTAPPQSQSESEWARFRDTMQFYWDFASIPLERHQRLRRLNPKLQPLVKEVARRQAAGEDMHYSMHIYREVRWRLNFTPDTARTEAEIDLLRRSLGEADKQKMAKEQQPSDGSWGMGINAWYLRFYYSVEDIRACQRPAHYPLTFLDQINSPEKLDSALNTDLYDAFTKTGVFNREETDETFSAIARLLFASTPTSCYSFDPHLRDALLAFVGRWQNPTTGCWGQWLVDRQGKVWKMDDMAMTFHVVSDLHGAVEHKDLIARRLLELDRVNFPAGILFDGHYENHLNWDAVKILRMAWPTLDEPTRQRARTEIMRMLRWCLSKSYQPDGSFQVSDLDDTPGDAYRYGIWFLQESGYFQQKDRFWTDQDFPEADHVRQQIETRLQTIGMSDPALQEAYDTLRGMDKQGGNNVSDQ
jgi:hypothetical protein